MLCTATQAIWCSSPAVSGHTFWNASDEPARILEIISPAGFERYFAEVVELLGAGPPEPSALGDIASRYGLEVDRESIPRLTAEYGLRFGPPSAE